MQWQWKAWNCVFEVWPHYYYRALGWAAERSSSRALFILLEGVDDDSKQERSSVFGFSFVRVVVHVVAKYYDISWPLSALARPFSVRLWASCRPELWVLVLSDTTKYQRRENEFVPSGRDTRHLPCNSGIRQFRGLSRVKCLACPLEDYPGLHSQWRTVVVPAQPTGWEPSKLIMPVMASAAAAMEAE